MRNTRKVWRRESHSVPAGRPYFMYASGCDTGRWLISIRLTVEQYDDWFGVQIDASV